MMDHARETMNMGNIAKGSALEQFEHAMAEVLKNIDDVNRSATQKREITLKFIFEPNESREVGEVAVSCSTKLAGLKAQKGNFFLARGNRGDLRGYARDPKQDELFAEQPSAGKTV